MDAIDVARAFLRLDGDVLACRRSESAPAQAGRWDAVSTDVGAGEDPAAAARRALRETAGVERATLVRAGSPLELPAPEGDDATAVVRPFLFDVDAQLADRRDGDGGVRAVALERGSSDEHGPGPDHDAVEWTPPTALLRRETVPGLWASYERVAPTVQSVVADDEHGAATLSIRALEVLRDRAGVLAAEGERDCAELAALARRLRRARPSMAVLRNRVNRALATAGEADDDAPPTAAAGATPADVEAAAIEGVARALAADAEAAMRAASRCAGDRVLTLSRSSTVLEALAADEVAAIAVAESRPAREGVGVAEALAAVVDALVTLHTDAAIAHVLASDDVDAVLVGADTVLPDGRVVNKTGTRGAAIAATREDVPVYVAAATDKVTTREAVNLESGGAAAVYDGDADLDVPNPTFDVTPADAIDGIVTERGVLDPEDVGAVAEELRALELA